MKRPRGLFLATGLTGGLMMLAACQGGTVPGGNAPDASGGSVAEMGPGYCDAPPADTSQIDHWNQLCMPGR